ncbi:MAG: DUF2946 family protein [Candidatus Protistobacter heckmanni]|nr:DUF2946 family protein [Candidatus Protistobacter heckmanni]
MDEIVHQALAKCPNVPYCNGWLAPDRCGGWRMRNEFVQQNGLPGDPIRHAALIAFIERNYQRADDGCWYFQNGLQRVYLELEAAPWVVHLHPAPGGCAQPLCLTTTVKPFAVDGCLCDEQGAIFLGGALGELNWDGKKLEIELVLRAELGRRFGFVASPAADQRRVRGPS